VLTGERYKTVTAETAGVLKGEYGSAPAAYNKELQDRVLEGAEPITCRPADLLEPEMDKLTTELLGKADADGIKLAEGDHQVDDVLTYALFPQVGLKFLQNRDNPDAFEPVPTGEPAAASAPAASGDQETYTIKVNGHAYVVQINEGGDISQVTDAASAPAPAAPTSSSSGSGEPVNAPLSGNIWKILVSAGQQVNEGDVLLILEAMKMETQIVASKSGTVASISVKQGDAVKVGDQLVSIA
jgi:oxaloacetate decarboxylase alpha subunit